MKAKIMDHWVPGCNPNGDGYMDKYLGMAVTIRRSFGPTAVRIIEDQSDRGGNG